MNKSKILASETYDPNRLLDAVREKQNLKNDAALSRLLEVAPPVISKLRHKTLGIGDSILLRMHDTTGMPVNDLRDLMGVPRKGLEVVEALRTDE